MPRGDADRGPRLIVIAFGALLVVGAILALVTGSWWAVVLAAGAHAVGTLSVAGVVIQLTTETEHASPGGDTAAADRRRLAPIALVVVVGVIVFLAAMGLVGGYL